MADNKDPRIPAVIKALKDANFKRLPELVQAEFERGVGYSDMWESLDLAVDIFKQVAWEQMIKDKP